ncbi:mycothiol synthase [Corynebacterium pygosceleis]|uniref:mycothiol synthase n=1 Tax=Corynebacterium pygosceleis TaxID=2800406 RepID=UPI00396A2F53
MRTTTPTDPAAPTPARKIRDLAAAAADHDGVEPFSEQFLLGLDDGGARGHRHVIALTDSGELIGAAASDGATAELFVAPERRRRGVGTALFRELAGRHGTDTVWAHGDLPAAVSFCRSQGLTPVRELLVMAVTGADLATAAEVPEHTGTRILDLTESRRRYGADTVDAEWLRVNNEAFDWHPEQGGWDRDALTRGRDTDWFDPGGVLLLWSCGEGREDGAGHPELAGFHWTKWHGDDGSGTAVGEVYVVGLADDSRGRGLGGPLIAAGLRHLHRRGADEVILYVEADNTAAVTAYERLGFGVKERHVAYGSPKSSGEG